RYWKDPEEFRPERFLGDWPRHAFLPFAAGARACMGKRYVSQNHLMEINCCYFVCRFAEVEAIIVLCKIVANYRIDILEEARFAGETFEQRKARVLSCTDLITTTPERVPITFTRRHVAASL
ncbi:hypothetical protein FRC18_009661, partial [Serendipita sp. 400]